MYEAQEEEEEVRRKESARPRKGAGNEVEPGRWCSLCGLLVIALSIGYLFLLGSFLHHIATEGGCGF